MSVTLKANMQLSVGQYTDKGRKPRNEDACAVEIPLGTTQRLKGAVLAIADGISSSPVSHIASQTATKTFLADYFCTSEAWTVERAGRTVLQSINSWLYAESRHAVHSIDPDKGYVCTFSALVLKGRSAHLLHVGDSRIYRLRDGALEQLTSDHRLVVSQQESYLSRALGASEQIEVDYRSLPIQAGDVFMLATDGVYEFAEPGYLIAQLSAPDASLEVIAETIAQHALERGSNDNLSLQLVRVDALPEGDAPLLQDELQSLPFAPPLETGMEIDGYRIVRSLHVSPRSHCFLCVDSATEERVVLKVPSVEQYEDEAYLERFLLEEWIARRLNSAHIVRAPERTRPRTCFYTLTEYLEGQTLAQWLRDNPEPDLEAVRAIVEQVARGLLAFHRMDMLHQDIRPENLMIDADGAVRIIDFGSVRVFGIEESEGGPRQPNLLGTALYTAPEYFLGEYGSTQSDLYSLAVLAYHMLSGDFPYRTAMAKAHTAAAQKKLSYRSILDEEKQIPSWVDACLRKALHADPSRRYAELSEFLHDLRYPNPRFLTGERPPLLERNPVLFWQGVSGLLLLLVLYQAFY